MVIVVVSHPLDILGAVEGIIDAAGIEILEAGLELLAVGALVKLMRSAFELLGRDIAALLGRELKCGPMRLAGGILK
jgi:hypothetical protein